MSTAIHPEKNLTRKASLNAVASALDYAARLLVGFIITPCLVSGLGDFFFGTWQVLLRTAGSIAPASGRATQALKWTLANEQTRTDYEAKRRYVGSALAVWALFLPIIGALGAALSWYVPYWIKTPAQYYLHTRLAAGVLVLHLIMTNLLTIPQSVLEGENLGYKRMGASATLVLIGGGFTWLALYFKTGIVGVAGATLATTVITGLFFVQVAATWAPWFGVARPSAAEVKRFLGLSGWFMGWNMVMNLMMATDVAVLGMLNSVELVTRYSLAKYAPETLITIVAIMVFGMAPGLGSIIGSGQLEKAAQVRGEIMALTWLIVTSMGTTLLMWNDRFIQLWVGKQHGVGSVSTLLIIVVVLQFVLIRNDANIIDLTLTLRSKVLMGTLSAFLSLAAAALLVGVFKQGIAGLCAGIVAGRTMLTIGYPVLIGRMLKIPWPTQFRGALRPALVTAVLFGAGLWWNSGAGIAAPGWIGLGAAAGLTFMVALALNFFAGLSGRQRNRVVGRLRLAMEVAPMFRRGVSQ